LALDLSSSTLLVCVKFDPTTATAFQVYAGDAGLANSYIWYPSRPTTFDPDGWRRIELFTNGGGGGASTVGTPTPASIDKIRIQVKQGGGKVYLGAVARRPLPSAVYPNGCIVFTFDDTDSATINNFRPKLEQYGYPAVEYVIVSQVDTGGTLLSTAQCRELQDINGWEIGLHAYTLAAHNARYDTLTTAQLETEFSLGKQWLRANGFTSESWASPGGTCNPAVWSVARKYFNLHRSAGAGNANNAYLMTPQIADPFQVYGLTFDSVATTAATIATAIANAKAAKSLLVLNLHGFAGGASSGTQINAADFATIVDACNTQGVAVRTFSQIQDELGLAA
jgi:peptidoglycan/xylan/chitin deacetylase (PgdA/CDA1 family)